MNWKSSQTCLTTAQVYAHLPTYPIKSLLKSSLLPQTQKIISLIHNTLYKINKIFIKFFQLNLIISKFNNTFVKELMQLKLVLKYLWIDFREYKGTQKSSEICKPL